MSVGATKYYDVIECDNERKDANYRLRIKWNVQAIAGYQAAEGFIVQQVTLLDEAGIIQNYSGPYYEAWKVTKGKTKNNDYDDNFENGLGCFTEIVTENSIGKKGKIEYQTKVYWIDKSSSIHDEVQKWTPTVSMANELPSVMESECDLFVDVPAITERTFCHNVDF